MIIGARTLTVNQVGISAAKFDFDGDGKSDISVYRNGTWYLQQSTNGFAATQFGLATDKIAPADFDGDGKTDIAVFRDGVWYVLQSSNAQFFAVQFGLANDIPVPADFDGDGRAELAVFRNGTWYSLNLATNQTTVFQFGLANDKPVAADYDADGKADFAVYRRRNLVSAAFNSRICGDSIRTWQQINRLSAILTATENRIYQFTETANGIF